MWNLKIKEYYSFFPDEKARSEYNLIKLNDCISDLFLADIKRLEETSEASQNILCLRGDSKNNLNLHNDFFDDKLNKFFMIGDKAKSNYRMSTEDDFKYYSGKTDSNLLDEIEVLISTCNKEILSKPSNHNIRGEIRSDFLNTLRGRCNSELEHWRLFFISFLHNNGKGKIYKSFKDYSPFVSLTYGPNKHSVSRKFALNRANHKIGFIYIVAINKDGRNYIKTNEMVKKLLDFGVTWYKDIHKEIMLINGIFPHHILGLLEVKATRTPRLIINPWLYKQYLDNEPICLDSGISINQEYFGDWINQDELKRYFFKDYEGDEYVSEIEQSMNCSRVSKFKK